MMLAVVLDSQLDIHVREIQPAQHLSIAGYDLVLHWTSCHRENAGIFGPGARSWSGAEDRKERIQPMRD